MKRTFADNDLIRDVKALWKEYAPPKEDDLLFSEEDPKTIILKEIISKMNTYDRTILLLYVEMGSLHSVAKYLEVSHSAIIKKMDEIKARIMDEYFTWQRNKIEKNINDKIQNK